MIRDARRSLKSVYCHKSFTIDAWFGEVCCMKCSYVERALSNIYRYWFDLWIISFSLEIQATATHMQSTASLSTLNILHRGLKIRRSHMWFGWRVRCIETKLTDFQMFRVHSGNDFTWVVIFKRQFSGNSCFLMLTVSLFRGFFFLLFFISANTQYVGHSTSALIYLPLNCILQFRVAICVWCDQHHCHWRCHSLCKVLSYQITCG